MAASLWPMLRACGEQLMRQLLQLLQLTGGSPLPSLLTKHLHLQKEGMTMQQAQPHCYRPVLEQLLHLDLLEQVPEQRYLSVEAPPQARPQSLSVKQHWTTAPATLTSQCWLSLSPRRRQLQVCRGLPLH